ncbi:Trypsin-like peptidase domain-containing protein [Fontimonas thermophila]|uniref:Trypsin-like peptidase domain-containing protein n=1 Tax=Fontimonas thermophila TaxID=1076937 RepID=A0A1I2JQH5_9GAMM|nr:trypsin-like peptidase domain-containing protein [Fontimonas thermophila]SFF55016.1 Trypsin-like peptidase domain-containing protein [Fontimonas thermophila]
MRIACWIASVLLPCTALAFVPDTTTLAPVPRLTLPDAAVADAIDAVKHEPLRYAIAEPLNTDVRHGLWDTPAPGLARWRLRIASAGAHSLSLRLVDLRLPPATQLWLYSADGRDVQGPLRSDGDSELLTPLVRGAEAVLEARMPDTVQQDFAVTVAEAFHGYRPLFPVVRPKGQFGDSGACEIDVACPDGDAWRPQIRAAVLLTIGNSTLCSGTLVNNTAEDGRPLVLTANHCGITPSTVTRTIAYFNVQKPDCGSGADGPVNQNLRGKTWLAADSASDFTLFELTSAPPPTFAAHYAGWNARSDTVPRSGVVIHHPGGDDKKISTYTNPATRADDVCIGGVSAACVGGMRVNAWQVEWARGATEGGSSGSGLYDQNKRLVGVLSGGDSACAGDQNNGGSDFFGRLDVAWVAGSNPSAQLKAHLDPTGSGCLSLDGRDADTPPSGRCAHDPGGGTDSGGTGNGSGGGGAAGASLLMLLACLLRLSARRAWRA